MAMKFKHFKAWLTPARICLQDSIKQLPICKGIFHIFYRNIKCRSSYGNIKQNIFTFGQHFYPNRRVHLICFPYVP